MRTRVLVLCSLAIGLAANAAAQDDLAFQRAEHLKRGVNLSMWYAQANDYSAARLASYTTAADFKLVHDLGFDHVRLSINPEPLLDDESKGSLKPDAMASLDATVKQITATGLVVVLDIHPEEPWKLYAMTQDVGSTNFLLFWKSFAQHFASTDPEKVYFELLNEPDHVDPYRWDGLQARAMEVVRRQVPKHTIIATGVDWGGIDGLLQLAPVRDDDVIYSFHDYEPMTFTHQGATWAGDSLIPLRGVPYPSNPEKIAALIVAQSSTLTDPRAVDALKAYGEQRWDADVMSKRIDQAVTWAKQRHVPLWCGEFGVYETYAPPADRAHWIADMRTTLEKDGIGWDMWDYQGGFALVHKKNGVPIADPALVTALGLRAKQ